MYLVFILWLIDLIPFPYMDPCAWSERSACGELSTSDGVINIFTCLPSSISYILSCSCSHTHPLSRMTEKKIKPAHSLTMGWGRQTNTLRSHSENNNLSHIGREELRKSRLSSKMRENWAMVTEVQPVQFVLVVCCSKLLVWACFHIWCLWYGVSSFLLATAILMPPEVVLSEK